MSKRKKLAKGAKMRSEEDYLGSYTGTSVSNPNDVPVQDADDL